MFGKEKKEPGVDAVSAAGVTFYGTHDLGNGYTIRVDKPHVKNDQIHVHIEKHGNEVANQNDDGSPHHPNKNKEKPSKSMKKKIKEKLGWDWDKMEQDYKYSDRFINPYGIFAIPLPTPVSVPFSLPVPTSSPIVVFP